MASKKRVVIFFVSFICLIYLYGILNSFTYQNTLSNTQSINLDKSSFLVVNYPELTIENRELNLGESQIYLYKYGFSKDDLKDLNLSVQHNENIYLMIEKPDANYFEVQLNNQNIGRFGEFDGNSNIWNGTFFIRFNENIIEDENVLTILEKSSYMTGVAGDIRFLNDDDYHRMQQKIEYGFDLIKSAIIIAFLVAIIIGIVVMAWYKELYNIRVYLYFFISIVAIGISLFDFSVTQSLPMDYLLFKKIIIVSYHVTTTFATLAVASLFNSKHKINIGMIGLILVLIKAFSTTNMIEWRNAYTILNLFLVASIVQLLFYLFIYRKRAPIRSFVLTIGFSLGAITVIKLIYITNLALESTMLIDLSILVIIYAAVVLFVFYIELLQMVDNYDLSGNELQSMSLQGSFTIDKTLHVVGSYTNSCNTIFDQLIVGQKLTTLMYDENEREFIRDILESIFDIKNDFKEGFIDLLPNEIALNEKKYKVYYQYLERTSNFLKITLSDVTKSTNLKSKLEEKKWEQRFLINALKSKQEVSFFINKAESFFRDLRNEGFTIDNQRYLHILKGNLGQFGFVHFERTVHEVETSLESDSYDTSELVTVLEQGLNQAVAYLEQYIGKDYFTDSYQEVTIQRSLIDKLESSYLSLGNMDTEVLKQIRHLRNIDIKKMLSRYKDYIARMAEELDKAVLPFHIQGESVFVEPSKTEELMMVLVGIFRNSLIHGIESPEDRIDFGKDSYGLITCQVKTDHENLVLNIRDDGSGVDTESVLKQAINAGMLTEVEGQQLSRSEILKLIFTNRLSTEEFSNILAGRGVGLSAVVDVVNKLDGQIDIISEERIGTEFIISIPLSKLID
ncbi:MAG: hypothetical protein JEZ08_09360 [Clostridiales bacterium]|nr:hypothetical protein [Clostridiales bacterium]